MSLRRLPMVSKSGVISFIVAAPCNQKHNFLYSSIVQKLYLKQEFGLNRLDLWLENRA